MSERKLLENWENQLYNAIKYLKIPTEFGGVEKKEKYTEVIDRVSNAEELFKKFLDGKIRLYVIEEARKKLTSAIVEKVQQIITEENAEIPIVQSIEEKAKKIHEKLVWLKGTSGARINYQGAGKDWDKNVINNIVELKELIMKQENIDKMIGDTAKVIEHFAHKIRKEA